MSRERTTAVLSRPRPAFSYRAISTMSGTAVVSSTCIAALNKAGSTLYPGTAWKIIDRHDKFRNRHVSNVRKNHFSGRPSIPSTPCGARKKSELPFTLSRTHSAKNGNARRWHSERWKISSTCFAEILHLQANVGVGCTAGVTEGTSFCSIARCLDSWK